MVIEIYIKAEHIFLLKHSKDCLYSISNELPGAVLIHGNCLSKQCNSESDLHIKCNAFENNSIAHVLHMAYYSE